MLDFFYGKYLLYLDYELCVICEDWNECTELEITTINVENINDNN